MSLFEMFSLNKVVSRESPPTRKLYEKKTKVTAMYGNRSLNVIPLCLFIYLLLYLNSLLFICKKSKLSVLF